MNLTSMKLKRSSKKKLRETMAVHSDPPEYPWGLELNFEKEAIKKLGIKTDDVSAGDTVYFTAKANVSSLNQSDRVGEPNSESMGLQITHIGWGKPS